MSFENYRWTCACCGKEMTGLPMDVSYAAPGVWNQLDDATRARSLLNSDFCWIEYGDGEADRFIRCLMTLPVIGTPQAFGFGVWVSVSEASWRIYKAGFDTGVYAEEGCFGYLGHEIADYPGSELLHANVFFEPENRRPSVILKAMGHPLADAQQHGIPLAQVERWVAMSAGH